MSGETLNIADAYKDLRFNKEIDAASGYRTRSILCIPIFADGKIVAVAQLINKKDRSEDIPFTAEDEKTLKDFGTFAGICLRNGALHLAVQRRTHQVETILNAARSLSECDALKCDDDDSAIRACELFDGGGVPCLHD